MAFGGCALSWTSLSGPRRCDTYSGTDTQLGHRALHRTAGVGRRSPATGLPCGAPAGAVQLAQERRLRGAGLPALEGLRGLHPLRVEPDAAELLELVAGGDGTGGGWNGGWGPCQFPKHPDLRNAKKNFWGEVSTLPRETVSRQLAGTEGGGHYPGKTFSGGVYIWIWRTDACFQCASPLSMAQTPHPQFCTQSNTMILLWRKKNDRLMQKERRVRRRSGELLGDIPWRCIWVGWRLSLTFPSFHQSAPERGSTTGRQLGLAWSRVAAASVVCGGAVMYR